MRKVTETFFAAGQIQPDDVAAIKAAGITLIINNRPDGEDAGQPTAKEVLSAVQTAGIRYVAIPVQSGTLDPDAIDPMREALASATGPVLAFCRSGTRSTTLWAMAQCANGAPVADIVAAAGSAGYDLTPLTTLLQNLAEGKRG
jgi:uncharacterized protein (TIGR01244 family)